MSAHSSGRFVPQEYLGDVQPWSFEAVSRDGGLSSSQQRFAEEFQAKEAALRQEGYAQGFVQGHAQAMVEAQQRIQAYIEGQGQQAARDIAQLLRSVQDEWDQARQQLAEQILQLAIDIARQVLLRQPRMDAAALQALVQEATRLMEAEVEQVSVHLNPTDFALLQAADSGALTEWSRQLRPDPDVAMHGCVVRTGTRSVDASLATRWQRVVASLGLEQVWVSIDEHSR